MAFPLLLLSAGLSAFGSYKQGKAQQANYLAQAQIERDQTEAQARNLERQAEADRFNSEMAEQDALDVQFAASLDEDKQRREGRQVLSSQRAAMMQNGVSGSFASDAIEMQSLVNLEMDALNIRYAGALQGRGLMAEAKQYKESSLQADINADTTRRIGAKSAANLQTSASNAKRAGTMGAVSSLLGGYIDYKAGK